MSIDLFNSLRVTFNYNTKLLYNYYYYLIFTSFIIFKLEFRLESLILEFLPSTL